MLKHYEPWVIPLDKVCKMWTYREGKRALRHMSGWWDSPKSLQTQARFTPVRVYLLLFKSSNFCVCFSLLRAKHVKYPFDSLI